METIIEVEELKKYSPFFWSFFFCACFPNGYLESDDIEICDYIQENYGIDMEWVHLWTKYNPKVFDENDGYVESPRTLIAELNGNFKLSIEFHPGDTIFYLNGQKIGCTGPHFQLYGIAWNQFIKLTMGRPAEVAFALLPMAYFVPSQYHIAEQWIKEKFLELPFEGNQDTVLLKCILENLQQNP